ncbi:uncharacterized protein LOC124627622 isoform X1 [Ictalurus punctatus]|uniref:Uncharacterized protein LOC124627622 isoform X1 n=1 Tax=Ictalurus punctatus TaxID=7998 RepID=A0A9F7R646_ICTPU|nr:uncharacterized protein LOC124627622 isoform X1 [Ictalurus punctatus]
MTSNMSVSGKQDLKRDERMMEGKRSDSPEPSCVSMKSDRSMDHPFDFRDRANSPDVRPQQKKSNLSRNQLDSIFKELEHKVFTLIKNELKRFRKLLSPDYPACTEREVEDEQDLHSVREGALKITLHVLKNMNHTDLANTLHNKSVASVYQTSGRKDSSCARCCSHFFQHSSWSQNRFSSSLLVLCRGCYIVKVTTIPAQGLVKYLTLFVTIFTVMLSAVTTLVSLIFYYLKIVLKFITGSMNVLLLH